MAICSTMWSTAGILIKILPWNSSVIAGFRGIFGAVIIGLWMLVKHLRFTLDRKSILSGLLLTAVSFTFLAANKLTSAANAIVLQYTAPIFVLIYCAAFRKQHFRFIDYITVILTLFGIVLFFVEELTPGKILGNFLGILSGVVFAGTMILNPSISENERMTGLLSGFFLAALIGVPLVFVYDTPFTLKTISAICALGIFQMGIPYLLFGLAAEYCPPLTLVLLSSLEPALNPVWVFLFTGEKLSLPALSGFLIVLLSVTTWVILDRKMAH